MKARELIASAVLEPATLTVVCAAFDSAWNAVRDRHSSELEIARARMLLARAALMLISQYPTDVEALTRAILARAGQDFECGAQARDNG
jgi:hypothetical protein